MGLSLLLAEARARLKEREAQVRRLRELCGPALKGAEKLLDSVPGNCRLAILEAGALGATREMVKIIEIANEREATDPRIPALTLCVKCGKET